MKVEILSRGGRSFVPVLASSLYRMLQELGVDARLNGRGDAAISSFGIDRGRLIASAARTVFGSLGRATSRSTLDADLVVVVGTAPSHFLRARYRAIESWIRARRPELPIVLLVSAFHGGNNWHTWLRIGSPDGGIEGGQWGLERFDWYLCSRRMNVLPIPASAPVTEIGLFLDDGSLYPEQTQFQALLDFERPREAQQRAIHKQALEKTGTPFIELSGSYSLADIRAIYRSSALYFPACFETFGLPICETRSCGACVATAFAHWCSAHWIERWETAERIYDGRLPKDFPVYHGSEDTLVSTITELRDTFDPDASRQRFLSESRDLYYGNTEGLKSFLQAVARGEIHGRRHTEHAALQPGLIDSPVSLHKYRPPGTPVPDPRFCHQDP